MEWHNEHSFVSSHRVSVRIPGRARNPAPASQNAVRSASRGSLSGKMAVDKKQRLVPGSMYIPPTLPLAMGGASLSPGGPGGASSASLRLGSSPRFSSSGSAANAATAKALTPNKPLGDLLRSIEPRFCFQPAVEELLLDMASDFIEDVVAFSSRLAKHRRSTELQAKDLQFCLAKNYGISLAGAVTDRSIALNPLGADVQVRARPGKNSLHMHRIALKRQTMQRASSKLKRNLGVKISDAAAARKTVQRKSSTAGIADPK